MDFKNGKKKKKKKRKAFFMTCDFAAVLVAKDLLTISLHKQ